MITKDNITEILLSPDFGFTKDQNKYKKHFGSDQEGFELSYDADTGEFNYPEGVETDRNTTTDEHQKESYVVFLCVAQLFERGYLPRHFKLEGRNFAGNDLGWCDILVKDNDGVEYLIIECKTADLSKKDDEFRKHWNKTLRNGDQLFRYFNTYRRAKYLCLLSADYPEFTKDGGQKEHRFENIYHIISLVDNDEYLKTNPSFKSFQQMRDEQGTSDDFFDVWKATYMQDYNTRGLLEPGIDAFNIGNKSYSLEDLKTVDEYSLEKKYHEFALILRKHTISSHENAFDKLINLFIAKIIDETYYKSEDGLKLLWKGAAYDDYFSLQDRLTVLYLLGMKNFFNDDVAYVENKQIDEAFKFLSSSADVGKETIKKYFRKLKYFNNNPFAFLDVHNEKLFYQNAVILKDVINMLQDIYLTSNNDNQFLGDLFEGFLNKGVHQSEGQFFTPIPIVRFLVSSLPLKNIIGDSTEIPKAIDYACGSGHFLTEYARQIIPIITNLKNLDSEDENYNEKLNSAIKPYFERIEGIEKDYRLSKVSQVAAYMYGMDGIHIHYSDALINIPEIKEHTYNVLIANPPYAVSGFLETLTEEERKNYTLSAYVSSLDKNDSIETFFIERGVQLLASGGVATVILPASVLSSRGLYMRSRELILKYFDLVSICCFGPNTFGQTNTSTVALFLRRKAMEPDSAEHYKNRVEAWFAGNMDDDDFYQDSKLLEDYIKKMGYQYDDYVALLKGELTESFKSNEMIQDYIKALNIPRKGNDKSHTLADEAKRTKDNAKNYIKRKQFKSLSQKEKEEYYNEITISFIREIEKEKLYYFLLATDNHQQVLVVQTPLNDPKKKDDKEQSFLGYEWSKRKGAEGIHYLNTGAIKAADSDDEAAEDNTLQQIKGVDGIITPLFNPQDLINDETKINSFIRKAFNSEYYEVPEDLGEVVFNYNLEDMLDFSKVGFDKEINTNIAFKMVFTSKYPLESFKKYVDINPSKVHQSDDTIVSFIEMSSVSENGYIRNKVDKPYSEVKKGYKFFQNNDIIIAKITPCMENGKCAIVDGLTNNIGFGSTEFHVLRCKEGLLNGYLFALLNTPEVRYFAMKNMKGSSGHRRVPESFYTSMKIPVPPESIQKKIANECNEVDKIFVKNSKVIEAQSKKLFELVASLSGTKKKIKDVCNINDLNINPADTPAKEFIYIDIYAVENGTGYLSLDSKIIGKNAPSRARRYADSGSTIISTVRPYLRGFAFIEEEIKDAVYSTGFAILKSKDETVLPNKLIYYQFMYSQSLMDQMIEKMPKGSYPSINKDDIENFDILTSINNQASVIKALNACEKKIRDARKVIENCKAKKQAILDKYLKDEGV